MTKNVTVISDEQLEQITAAGREQAATGARSSRRRYRVGRLSVLGGYATLHPNGSWQYGVAGAAVWEDRSAAEQAAAAYGGVVLDYTRAYTGSVFDGEADAPQDSARSAMEN